MIDQIRMALAEWCLMQAIYIAPKNAEGARLAMYISTYASEKLGKKG